MVLFSTSIRRRRWKTRGAPDNRISISFTKLKRSCVALSIDMTNPCGAHGYAVMPLISGSLNEATRKCHEFGGKECVIRSWACDARG
jgi:hypothetical protein